MIIEGLYLIPNLMKYVPPGWRFFHCEHHSRINFLEVVANHVVAHPEGGNFPYNWLIRIVKTRYHVATHDDRYHQ